MTLNARQASGFEARQRILRHVDAHPGLHLRQLAQALAMPVSTLEYHCHVLERRGRLAVRVAGKFRTFFPPDGLDRRDKDVLCVVRRAAPRRIVAYLLEHPGATAGDVGAAAGLAPPTFSFHLRRLREARVVREEREWRTKRLYLEDPERAAALLATYAVSFANPALDAALVSPEPMSAAAPSATYYGPDVAASPA